MNNTKKRILWCGESSNVASGFGLYTKEILSRLHATNKYEIAELSCYRDYTMPKTEPWTIYPVGVPQNDPLYNEYINNDANQYGQWRFDYALLDFHPDIVIDVRDFWNFTYQDTSCFRKFYSWIIAPTYDSSPQKIETLNMFKNADVLMFHTEWAKTDLLNNFKYNKKNIGPIVNDAVDSDIFRPIGYSKTFHKNKFDIPSDTFVIGSVMRNQKRKLIPDILEAFKKALNSTKQKTILYLHTSYPDSLMWDIPQLLLEYELQNHVMFTYTCRSCKKYYPSLWRGAKTICKHCNNHSSFIASLRDPIDPSSLNNIYNLFDVYLQYAICEGFGIPVVEAASAGVPVITIDFGAMGDIGSKIAAKLIPVKRKFRELETNAVRCYPDNDVCADSMIEYINMSKQELNNIGKNTRKLLLNNFSWHKTAKVFEDVIDNIDISKNIKWDTPERKVNKTFKIDNDANIRKMIYSIIDNIILEPWIKETMFIEELIKSANDQYTINGTKILPFATTNAIKILELYMNNKIGLEMLRCKKIPMPDYFNNFLEYSKK